MLNDLLILLWLVLKRGKSNATYWLSLLGFEPKTSRIYQIYVVLFWIFWVLTMWAFGVEQIYQLSQELSVDVVNTLVRILPLLIFMMQVYYLFQIMRTPPLKLSAADIAYIASSPANSGAVALVDMMRSLSLPTVLTAISCCFLSMLITWPITPERVGMVGLQTILLVPFAIYINCAFSWAIALCRLRSMKPFYKQAFWMIIPLLVLGVQWKPKVFMWLGYALVASLNTPPTLTLVGEMFIVGLVATIILILSGNGVEMSVIVESSQLYARISRLGFISRFYARDVILRIHKQHRLMKIRRFYLTLPVSRNAFMLLFNRATLVLLRLLPQSIMHLFFQGATLTLIVTSIIKIIGLSELQTWIFILVLLIQSRNLDILETFRSNLNQTFLRQFLPSNTLTMLLADAGWSLIFSYLGSLLVIAFLLPDYLFPGAVLSMLIGVILAICQAFDIFPEKFIIKWHIPYEYFVAACGCPIIIIGYMTQSFAFTIGAAGIMFICLSLLLFATHRQTD